jgi:hypothetical protein
MRIHSADGWLTGYGQQLSLVVDERLPNEHRPLQTERLSRELDISAVAVASSA